MRKKEVLVGALMVLLVLTLAVGFVSLLVGLAVRENALSNHGNVRAAIYNREPPEGFTYCGKDSANDYVKVWMLWQIQQRSLSELNRPVVRSPR